MSYEIIIHVDGGCRRNGRPGAIGAAAAVFNTPWGAWNNTPGQPCLQHLPDYPTPTAERAEITAVILALRQTLEQRDRWVNKPWLNVKIYSDCQSVVNCMNQWIHSWSWHEWRDFARYEVRNGDLLQEAAELDDRLRQVGYVEYAWIPRQMNEEADRWVNQAMNDIEQNECSDESTDDDGYDSGDEMDEDGDVYGYDSEDEDEYDSEDDMEDGYN